MRHATVNIGRHGDSRRAIENVAKTMGKYFAIGWQEIDSAVEQQAIKDCFPKAKTIKAQNQNPITYRVNPILWKPVGTESIFGHEGIPKVTPQQDIILQKFQHRLFKGNKLALVNSHVIAGAFNQGHDERQTQWYEWFRELQATVNSLHNEGFNTVVRADFNRGNLPVIHSKAVEVARHMMDHIIAIPAKGRTVNSTDHGTIVLGIDIHLGVWANITFPKVKR
jgi:hypothetical protein